MFAPDMVALLAYGDALGGMCLDGAHTSYRRCHSALSCGRAAIGARPVRICRKQSGYPAAGIGYCILKTSGALREMSENLWVADGSIQMPPGPLPRRMTIARLPSGDLVIFSAIALDDAGMAQVDHLGSPRFLVVPNAFHREDAQAWKSRYPAMRVVAPEGAVSAVNEVVRVDDTVGDFGDHSVRFVPVAGTNGESALVVHHQNGVSLVINDLIANVQDARGVMKLVLTLMGFAGSRPQVPRMYKKRAVEDPGKVARHFREWASLPGLARIIVSHGAIIEDGPTRVLRQLADKLSPNKDT